MDCLEYPIVPVPKPRMTQRDVWEKCQVVVRYRTFCDAVRNAGLVLPESDSIVVTSFAPIKKRSIFKFNSE
ncbi:hypothetical protein [Arsenophonus sp. PmNCSU2021_1]|uniref:hypothetical protein n=1 Tax=Arsenophonus sp. PmNCSU2021_1 TaxID=3118989 RepID=UPI002FEED6A0